MRILLSIIIILLFGNYAFSQSESKAKDILDKVADTNNGHKTIKADFKFTTNANNGDQSHSESGKIWMKGDKYRLTLSNSDIVFDGKNIYTFIKTSNEINITKPEPAKIDKGDFFFSNPRDIFKGYTKNFKSTFIKETNKNNNTYYEIDLFPIDLKTKYSRLRMHIQKLNYQIADIKLFLKDGTQYLLEFSNFVSNIDIDNNEFMFDTKKYPGAEVNDMRF